MNLSNFFENMNDALDPLSKLSRVYCLRGALSRPTRRLWETTANVRLRGYVCELARIDDERTASAQHIHETLHSALECADAWTEQERELLQKIDILTTCFQLNGTEARILLLALLIRTSDEMKEFATKVSFSIDSDFALVIADMVESCPKDVSKALAKSSKLFESGLLSSNEGDYGFLDLEDLIVPVSGLTLRLIYQAKNQNDLISRLCPAARRPALESASFDHYAAELDLICRLVSSGATRTCTGVNVLLYGPPGTGKSEMARYIAAQAGQRTAEISEIDSNGDALRNTQRIAKFQFTMKMLGISGGGAIVFDEVENILSETQQQAPGSIFSRRKVTADNKAWKTRLLEENRVPAIWIANDLSDIDPALLRRFSFSLFVGTPPRKKRQQLLEQTFGQTGITQSILQRVADQDRLTPADIARTDHVLQLITSDGCKPSPDDLVRVISARVGGISRVRSTTRKSRIQLPYRESWINADTNLSSVAESMKQSGFGRIGLFGPPGTGKTAYALNLADRLDVTCIKKKASDLISPYIGKTEKAFARAFEEAHDENALLFMDEADSFVRSRENATRSWEFSQVNELLTQIDEFEGYLVVASNYGDQLDAALARRLDLKVHMNAIRNEDLMEVIQTACHAMGIPCCKHELEAACAHLHAAGLTLGDISAGMRQTQLTCNKPKTSDLVHCLLNGLDFRSQLSNRPIGFTADLH